MKNESYGSKRDKLLRAHAIEKLGGKCTQCGFDDARALQFDHVNSDGKEDRKLGPGQRYMKILRDTGDNFQLLCANCNWIKKFEKKEVGRRWPKGHVPKKLATKKQRAAIRLVPSEFVPVCQEEVAYLDLYNASENWWDETPLESTT